MNTVNIVNLSREESKQLAHILLMCSTDHWREDLMYPFFSQTYIYASDGYALIRYTKPKWAEDIEGSYKLRRISNSTEWVAEKIETKAHNKMFESVLGEFVISAQERMILNPILLKRIALLLQAFGVVMPEFLFSGAKRAIKVVSEDDNLTLLLMPMRKD